MKHVRPHPGEISAPWSQPRPLSVPPEKRDHVHGAVDIRGSVGDVLDATVGATVYRFCIVRPEGAGGWRWPIKRGGKITALPFGDYPYDIFGAVTVLVGDDGLVHLYCHSYLNQLWRWTWGNEWQYEEQPDDARWPVMLWHTFDNPERVDAGEPVAEMGNAGYSFGPHLHWEVHRGWTLTPHAERPDPGAWL